MTFSPKTYHVSLIGRPNVGKSMLFNALTQSQCALVHSAAGVTRDRKSALCSRRWSDFPIMIHDLGGLTEAMFLAKTSRSSDPMASISTQMRGQATEAIRASDLVFFVVDAREGICGADQEILGRLRKIIPPTQIMLILNKSEFSQDPLELQSAFFELGLGPGVLVSAAHRQGLHALLHEVDRALEERRHLPSDQRSDRETTQISIKAPADWPSIPEQEQRVVFIGRPNVGKSTLTNAFLKTTRMITSPLAGTTREAIASLWEHADRKCWLVDTAGIRKRSTITEKLEYLGVNKALAEIQRASVVVLVLDVEQAGEKQDLILVQKCLDLGRALVVALNKVDQCSQEELKKKREALSDQLRFAPYLPIVEVSAKFERGLQALFQKIFFMQTEISQKFSTAQLNRILQEVLLENAPPLCKKTGRRIRVKYVHQTGSSPIKFSFRGNQLQALPEAYKKFLEKRFRHALHIRHIPILFSFENQDNPFAPD